MLNCSLMDGLVLSSNCLLCCSLYLMIQLQWVQTKQFILAWHILCLVSFGVALLSSIWWVSLECTMRYIYIKKQLVKSRYEATVKYARTHTYILYTQRQKYHPNRPIQNELWYLKIALFFLSYQIQKSNQNVSETNISVTFSVFTTSAPPFVFLCHWVFPALPRWPQLTSQAFKLLSEKLKVCFKGVPATKD